MPTQTTRALQCIPRCLIAPLDAYLAGYAGMVGIAALTPPYGRVEVAAMPTQTTRALQCIPRCLIAPLDAYLTGNIGMVGIAALTPPYAVPGWCFPTGEGGVFWWWRMVVGGRIVGCPTIDVCGCRAAPIFSR